MSENFWAIGFWQPDFWAAGFWAEEDEEEPQQPNPPPAGGFSDAPWRWVPFHPVAPKRPRKRRQAEILFLGR